MKKIICLILLFQFLIIGKIYSQKNLSKSLDKTTNWTSQTGYETLVIDNKSSLSGENFYKRILINPKSLQNLHLEITNYTPGKYDRSTKDFAVQVKSHNKLLLNTIVNKKNEFKENIAIEVLDTIAVIIIVPNPGIETITFTIDYRFAELALDDYKNNSPKDVFIKMLQLASTGFINLPPHENFILPQIDYPNGLFYPLPAKRVGGALCETTQYTGKNIKTREEADAINAKWNKQIKDWIKDLNVTNIKKNITGKTDLNTDEEETIYEKTSNQGVRLFNIIVYRHISKVGNEFNPLLYETGIVIY